MAPDPRPTNTEDVLDQEENTRDDVSHQCLRTEPDCQTDNAGGRQARRNLNSQSPQR
jgi:hypothetical protein